MRDKKEYIVFSVIVSVILMITLVSALEIIEGKKDFKKEVSIDMSNFTKENFNEKYGAIEYTESILGIDNYIATYTISNISEGSPINKWIEGSASLDKDMKLFDEVFSKNIFGDSQTINGKYFLEETKTIYEFIPNKYKSICLDVYDNISKSQKVCKDIVDTYTMVSHEEESWKPYNGEILPQGDYKWRFEFAKNPTIKTDIVFKIGKITTDEWVWFNDTFNKERAINISISGNPTINDTQVPYNLTYDSDMASDFSGVVFANATKTGEIPAVLERKVNGAWALYTLRIDQNVTTANQTLAYAYYNNTTTVTYNTSNNYTIYPFYDTFDATNSSQWFPINGEGAENVSGGLLLVDEDWVQGNGSFGYGYAFESKINSVSLTAFNEIYMSSGKNNASAGWDDYVLINGANTVTTLYTSEETVWGSNATNVLLSNQLVSMVRPNSSIVQGYFNNVLILQNTTNIPNERLNFTTREWGGAGNFSLEWVRVRAWNDTPYLISTGDEQTYSSGVNYAPNITLISPVDTYNSTSRYVIFNASIYDDTNLTNVSIIINNSINTTNTSGVNNTYYTFNISMADGTYTWRINASDSTGNRTTSSQRTLTVDTTSPNVTILYPLNTTYTSNVSQLNFTSDGTFCWYSQDLGTTNSSRNNCASNFTGLTNVEGINSLRLYANDTYGNTNSTTIYYTIDTTAPLITINNPVNQSEENSQPTNYIVTTNEIALCYISIDLGSNITMTTSNNLSHTYSQSMSDGTHDINFTCFDSSSNTRTNSTSFFFMLHTSTGTSTSSGSSSGVGIPQSIFTFDDDNTSTSKITGSVVGNVKKGDVIIISIVVSVFLLMGMLTLWFIEKKRKR